MYEIKIHDYDPTSYYAAISLKFNDMDKINQIVSLFVDQGYKVMIGKIKEEKVNNEKDKEVKDNDPTF